MGSIFKPMAERIADGFDVANLSFGEVSITVHISSDNESHPNDYECYTDDDKKKFGEYWRYVDVELTLEVAGLSASESLSGVEHGLAPRDIEIGYLSSVLADLYSECKTTYMSAAEAIGEAFTQTPEPCAWFVGCENEATGTVTHPILGEVVTCDRCRELASPHPRHAQCADGCGLSVTHDGACLSRPGGRQVCTDDEHDTDL